MKNLCLRDDPFYLLEAIVTVRKHITQATVLFLIILVMMLSGHGVSAASTVPLPVIHAVLFYSPSCPHCHEVMEQHLPPLVQKYGSQLDIIGIDVDHEVGALIYQNMIAAFNIPDERLGVPALVVGDQVLVGSDEIPQQFPGIVERGLSTGGIDWPNIPGLDQVIASQRNASPSAPPQKPDQENNEVPIFIQQFLKSPLGNTLAVIMLLVMIHAVLYVLARYLQGKTGILVNWPRISIPILVLLGLGPAIYLTYVEITGTTAICGPVGGCDTVQESTYAFLFGIIPVGLIGLAGYAAFLVAWAVGHFGSEDTRKKADLVVWGFAWLAILFMIYLTFLEPFIIGASCLWCLTTALIITMIFLASTGPALNALRLPYDDDDEELE